MILQPLLLDLPTATPAERERQALALQLRAAAPLRGRVEQHGAASSPLFAAGAQPDLFAAPTTAAAPIGADRSCHYHAGRKAQQDDQPRALPSYFTKPKNKNARDWLDGWDDALRASLPEQTPAQRYAAHQARLLAWTPANMVDRDEHGRPRVQTRAAQWDGLITMYHPETPQPFEVEVRGIRCVIAYHGGFATHAMGEPGGRFWSETGFRSFGNPSTDPAEVIADIERFIDAPRKDGNGCGGKLVRWWPWIVRQWQDAVAFDLDYPARNLWLHMGEKESARLWAKRDADRATALAGVLALGLDPNDIGPPVRFKGKWPRFDQLGLAL